MNVHEYGPGGFDPTKPNNNVVNTLVVADDPTLVNGISLRDKARQALAENATYLAITSPTAAQNTAQAKRLTRQVNALIKLLLNDLADVNGT